MTHDDVNSPSYMDKASAPLFAGETLIFSMERDNIGYAGHVIETSDGYYRLREWDDIHGWGDRSYRTREAAVRMMPKF